MKTAEFLDFVPRSFKTAAWTVSACIMGVGVAVIWIRGYTSAGALPFILNATPGFGFLLLAAAFVSTWILCLGYVYADARRRAMPPILWTLVAAFIPNLLGFLLYFACRRPIALPCAHCGQPIAPQQAFCSWCGQPGPAPLASQGKLA